MFCVSCPEHTPDTYRRQQQTQRREHRQRYYPAQQHKQRPETPRVCGVLLWPVALSEAAIRHPSSPPPSLLPCCACASGLSRPPIDTIIISIFSKYLSNTPGSHDARFWTICSTILAERSCLFFKTFSFIFVLCTYPRRHGQHTTHEQCRARAIPAGYNAVHACRPPAEQEATSRVCGSFSALFCCGFRLNTYLVIVFSFFFRTVRSAELGVSAVV